LLRKSKKGKSWVDLTMMERAGDRMEKMEGSCSTGQSPRRAVVPVEEEEVTQFQPRLKETYPFSRI
jgi:hypothetical protein